MEECPEGEKLAGAETVGLAYLLVKEAHPDAEGEEFEELFREVAREEFEELFREVAREVIIVFYVD